MALYCTILLALRATLDGFALSPDSVSEWVGVKGLSREPVVEWPYSRTLQRLEQTLFSHASIAPV